MPFPFLRVFLVRHAHAAWPMPGMRDFDRTLDERGREEAARLATAMVVNGFQPDIVHCSTARRCLETLDILLPRLGRAPRILRSEALYGASHHAYLDAITSHRDQTTNSVMIIGHNPMLEAATADLLANDPAAREKALGPGFPTAGLLIVDCQPEAGRPIGDAARFVDLLSPIDA